MKFNTKYDIDDTVYFMSNNKICEGHIREIRCSRTKGFYSESYLMKEDTGMNPPKYSVIQLFKTKKELLKQLYED